MPADTTARRRRHAEGRGLFPDLRLSPSGTWVLATGVALLAAGAMAASWTLALLGQVTLAFLVAGRLWADDAYQALRLGTVRATVAPVIERRRAAARAGRPLALQAEVTGEPALRSGALVEVLASADLGLPSSAGGAAPDRGGGLRLVAHPVRAGHWFLRGARLTLQPWPGLFRAEAWFPAEVEVPVLPGAPFVGKGLANVARRQEDQVGARRLRRAGIGSELREIRDHRPGDPFRMIAWKASARRGRLLVRELEREVSMTVVVALDISPSMRTGVPGATPLDHGVALAAGLVEAVCAGGDRAGLVTFDHRTVHEVRPGRGRAHVARVVRELLEVHSVVDGDLIAPRRDDVENLAADHIRYQDGLDVREVRGRGVDPALLAVCMRAELEATKAAPGADLLAAFCRARGIELPYRHREAPHDLERGLVAALESAVAGTRGPVSLIVLSDLQGAAGERLVRAVRAVRRARQDLVALVPEPGLLALGSDHPDAALVHRLLLSDEAADQRPAARLLRRLGVPVAAVGTGSPIRALLARLGRMRAAA
jgi:uncharacterized protein (DUF58 family)